MTTIDLHPEEMLDAARRGTLGAAATDDLRAHLARCVACRMSLTLADDLRAEVAAKSDAAKDDDEALLARMVRGALADEPRVAYDARSHRRAGSGRHVAVAIALLLIGGSGGAAVWSMGGVGFVRRFVPEIFQLPRPAAPAPRAPAAVVVPSPSAEPSEAPPASPAPPARVVRAHVEAAPALTADALFADANRARRAGDYPRALRRYAELRRAYPGSRQEMTARVVVGDLQLEEGPAREALASFDSYLAANPQGTLAEEARVGRAVALMRLGRRDEEREAWSQLLREHPNSVQRERARRRLVELR
ncbi:MAG TPA: tetratricopeptide repeat protein [Polyangia bacterium]|jgi:TolA-binding protein|nr:tetratricopeptide repeat protein [Polyangia bacterium]